jgi:hypothetical protein
MKGTIQAAARFATGGMLAVAILAALPSGVVASTLVDDPVLMCDETETLVVCCAVDEGKIKSCQIMPK